MHVLGCACMCWGQGGVSFGTQQCPTPQTRPSQKRLTKKFKNFIFLAVAAASGPRLASSFWTSVGSSNVAIPQSAAAVVVWREGRGRDHSGVQQHQRKQHAVGQQSKPQMQLQGIVRCKLQAVLKQGPCKEPTKQPAAACAGMAWVHRVQSSCELQRTHKHCMLAWINSWHASTPKDHSRRGPGVLQLTHVLDEAAVTHLSTQNCCCCSSLLWRAHCCYCSSLWWWKMELHTKGLPQSAAVP